VNRRTKLILYVAAALVGAAIFYAVYFHAVVGPVLERWQARRALASASSAKLEDAVGPLGAVMRFPDQSWIAIRYRDSHLSPGWSLAVARDSEGKWFESDEHFCGHLGILRDLEEMARLSGDLPSPLSDPPANRHEWLRLLAASPDLKTARQRLTSYFREVP
jgi:hypothetical protein